ncbi:MAG TPA: diguanylate cyclase [Actinomycetales bacterium]|nr:diguanylate cyclase [Actinomycetales bacterium]
MRERTGATDDEGAVVDEDSPYGERLDRLEELVWRDADAAHARALQLLQTIDRGVYPSAAARALLVQAEVESQRGLTEQSARIMRRVTQWADEHAHIYLQARSHRALSSLFRRVGDFALALEHAIKGVELLPGGARSVIRCDHLLALADALGEVGSYTESRRRYIEANELADRSGDLFIGMRVLNNWAYTEYEDDNVGQALPIVERLAAVSARHDRALDVHDLDTIARVYMLDGRLDAAHRILSPVRGDTGRRPRLFDERANALLTLAEIERLQGRTDDAQATLDQCRLLSDELELGPLQVRVRREQAELFAAAGRFELAFAEHKRFHDAAMELHSLEREARARTLQVLFETSEARRDSAHYRELSVHDALTGLPNRRFIDEHLGRLCAAAAESGGSLTVALVDLDHFKQVNDTLSHAVGDQVLCRVADLLSAGVGVVEGAIAARLGGEEFVLVVPADELRARELLDRVRSAVAQHDWSGLTRGLPVTISIGAAVAPDEGTERSLLLARADERLYDAKRAGRNRVVSSEGAAFSEGHVGGRRLPATPSESRALPGRQRLG